MSLYRAVNLPRKASIDATGALHHINARGIERWSIFINDIDRDDFVERLSRIDTESDTQCYAWAMIPNHFHLRLGTGKCPISTVTRRLLTGYAISFNHRHQRPRVLVSKPV
jgi:putative transposase